MCLDTMISNTPFQVPYFWDKQSPVKSCHSLGSRNWKHKNSFHRRPRSSQAFGSQSFYFHPPRPGGLRGETWLREVSLGRVFEKDVVWSNYDDFTRPRPISGKSRLVKYYNLARCCCCKLAASWMMSRVEWRHHYKVGSRIVINGVKWHL